MSADVPITIGIPTKNGGSTLDRLLAQLQVQEETRNWELLALDMGSTDDTPDRLRAAGARVLPIDPGDFDWGRLRQRLFEEARGAVVVNVSQDAVPAHEHWLENLLRPIDAGDADVSCGPSRPDAERPWPQFQWEKNGYFYFTREMAKFHRRYGRGLSFGNTAVRRSVWEPLGFDPQATGEDFQFQIKLQAAGARIAFPEDAPVLHHHYYNLSEVWRRCRNEGLALREMGCGYHEGDLLLDLLQPAKNLQWLREIRRGSMRNAAEWLYPVLRPAAVYVGSRFARKMVWYR